MIRTKSLRAGLVAAAIALGGLAAPAFADSIDFAQFGPVGTNVANGATGTTASASP
jgi:hypothetical protein